MHRIFSHETQVPKQMLQSKQRSVSWSTELRPPEAHGVPGVSICIPTYNGEEYLADCLDSISAQTFGDFEALIVDDCSSDGTVALARKYAEQDPRIRVVVNDKRLGLVGNWNRCVELARGDWIKYVFQDDLIAPDCLSVMLNAAEGGYLMISCDRDFIFAPDTARKDVEYYNWHRTFLDDLHVDSAFLSPADYARLMVGRIDVNLLGEPTAVLIHRSAFTRFGMFNPSLIQAADLEFWNRIGTNVGSCHIRQRLATFRIHSKSTTSHNHLTRKARLELERLILRHDVAFDESYENFRSSPNPGSHKEPLIADFWVETYKIMHVDKIAQAVMASDSAPEAAALFAKYPRLLHVPLRYQLRGFAERAYFSVRAMGGRILRQAGLRAPALRSE